MALQLPNFAPPTREQLFPDITGSIGQALALRKSMMENQYYPELMKSQIEAQNAKVLKAKILESAFNKMQGMNGGQNIIRSGQLNQPSSMGGNIPQSSLNMPKQTNISSPSNLPNINQSNLQNYGMENFVASQLGMGGTGKIEDINGTKVAITPFGHVIPLIQGLTPQQKSFQEGLGTGAAKNYEDTVKSYQGLQSQNLALDELTNAIDNPEFYNVTGPVSSFFKKWSGNPEQQQLLGSLQSTSGEIALQVAPSLKGAFTGRDQTLINTIKANPNTDFPDVFIGKLKAQKLINSVLTDRSKLAAGYMEQGMSPLKAHEKAAKETPLEKYRSIVNNLVNPKTIEIRNKRTGEIKKVSREEAKKLGVL